MATDPTDGDAVFEGPLRRGGRITITDERILVERPDEVSVTVATAAVADVSLQDVDWFLAVMSLGLVGFGLLSVGRSVVLGGAFAVAGVVSLGLTYRKRGAVRLRVSGETDPIRVFPADPRACFDALGAVVAAED
ncbi:hypothetical protein [Haloarcula litorea]|uniref:hypothetical protein n=1 Tax=Haloarcula litorea TaxID=3032579 RepID=UPI0023E7DDDA|nr:hypothetical protein [Halomicroarcula sp. GDY20]